MRRNSFFTLAALIIASLLQAVAQNHNQTPGSVVGWGFTVIPRVDPGTQFTAIAAGLSHILALKSDGTVVAWGQDLFGQSTVPAGLNGVVAIAAGREHSLALVRDQLRLEISAGENAVVLSWPVSADGYVVESARALATPEWETATNAPAILADRYVLTNSWSGESRFFRLRPQ